MFRKMLGCGRAPLGTRNVPALESGETMILPDAQSIRDRPHARALVRSQRALRWSLGAALLILLALVTLPPVISTWAVALRQQLSEQIQAFEDTRLRIENNVQSMQAATRGYIITQQPSFLEAYGTAAAAIPGDLQRLEQLAPLVDPLLVPQVAELRARVTRWQEQGPELHIALVQQDNLAGAVANVSAGQSQQRFDAALEQLRLLGAELVGIDARLTARISGLRRLETGLGLGLGLLGLGLGAYLVRIVGGVARLTREIDYQRQRAEEAVVLAEAANAAVVREQQRLQAVFDHSPEGIVLAEAGAGRILLANQAARTLLDDPLPLGQPLSPDVIARLYRATGERSQPEHVPLLRALAGAAQIGVELTIEQRAGRRVPVLFNAVPLHDAEGRLEGAVAVFQDLSRFREVERLKSDFVALVSHELRTPLTAIQGCVQSLLHTPGSPDSQRAAEFLQIIATQSARLHELIDNLLDMSQLEAGTFRLRVSPLQPGQLIRSVVRHANERLPGLTVQADLSQPLPTLAADAQRIEQVLLNLIDNARKWSPPEGVITVRAEPRPDEICISVRDQGPGIPPEQRERIFERFFQGSPPNGSDPEGTSGTGLGLAICRAIVEAHGGRIWVDPAVTAGARLCFSLPRTPIAPPAEEDGALLTALPRRAHDTAHILVVDDEPALRQMLEGSLRSAGYVVGSVPEGQAAIEYLATERPDLVILDVMLPGQDGFRVLQQLRDWSEVLVLMLTAAPEPQNVVRGLELGADDYLTKPFNMPELLARVTALLRRRQPALELDAPTVVQRGPLTIDLARRSVTVNGAPVELTPTEFRLLTTFAQHPGQVLTHTQLLQQVWGPQYGGENHYLWVHIGRLRQKIEPDPKTPQLIVTERGVGYRLAAEG